jgi:hypothetical protein
MDRATFEPFAALLRKLGPISDRALDQLRDRVRLVAFDADGWLLRDGAGTVVELPSGRIDISQSQPASVGRIAP